MIAGIEPCSFVDYPGRLAAVLFLQGCNLHCPYCHNPELIGKPKAPRLATDKTVAWLQRRFGRLTGVVITGGEPTLQPELPQLLTALRAIGYRIKLDTNGTRPAVLRQLLDLSLLDYVAMDLKDLPQNYETWLSSVEVTTTLLESLALLKSDKVDHEWRTTILRSHPDLETLDQLRLLLGDDARWYLQRAHDDVPFRQDGLSCVSQSELDSLAAELKRRGARNVFARGSQLAAPESITGPSVF